MREVRLYGHLGKTFGTSFMLNVKSPAEALAALAANFRNFRAYLHQHRNEHYKVVVGKRTVDEPELACNSSGLVIKFIPVVAGSGGTGIFQTIIGAVLLAVSFIPGFQMLAPVGISLMIGGVAQMLAPTPSSSSTESADNKPSYTFSGVVNTTTQGNPVPICYGEMIVGSQVVSAGISTEQTYVSGGDYEDSDGGSENPGNSDDQWNNPM